MVKSSFTQQCKKDEKQFYSTMQKKSKILVFTKKEHHEELENRQNVMHYVSAKIQIPCISISYIICFDTCLVVEMQKNLYFYKGICILPKNG